jgi:hypothetical protein
MEARIQLFAASPITAIFLTTRLVEVHIVLRHSSLKPIQSPPSSAQGLPI